MQPVIGLIEKTQATACFIQQCNAQGFDAPVGQIGQGAQVGKGAQAVRGKGQEKALVQEGGPATLFKQDRVVTLTGKPDGKTQARGTGADDCNFHAKGPVCEGME